VKALTLGLVIIALTAFGAVAVNPSEVLDDPLLEKRARALSVNIRCLVCQNQSIDDSNADLARDLRVLVRERLVAGDSDTEVLDYLIARYGDFVMLKPPFKGSTYILWFGPLLVFVLAAIGLVVFFRRRQSQFATGGDAPVRLSSEERDRLARLLDKDDA
jgi:cytochrome c-type biogenesis protein CcmH